jgi:hypothetical protein
LIERLRELCRALSAAGLSAEDAAKLAGNTIKDSPTQIEVAPRDPSFSAAVVTRSAEGPGFSHVDLTLAAPGDVDELTSAFGEPRTPPRLHAGDTHQRIYRVGECRLIASLNDDGAVAEITLQPDA